MSASHEQSHPYHVLEPSPYPIATSFSLLLLVAGGVMWMHKHMWGMPVTMAGLLAVLICCFYWWRSTIREGIFDKAHNHVVQSGLRFGMTLFIASEVMFFVAFFWAFFNASLFPRIFITDGPWDVLTGVASWPPKGIETMNAWDLPLLNTLILLFSGTTLNWAHYAILHNKKSDVTRGLALTVALGVIFTALQALEYSHATFAMNDTVYGATFYLATGFHGAHVLIGTMFIAVNLVRSMRGTLSQEGHLGLEFAAWYWHFVDVVWLFLFVFVYWWGA